MPVTTADCLRASVGEETAVRLVVGAGVVVGEKGGEVGLGVGEGGGVRDGIWGCRSLGVGGGGRLRGGWSVDGSGS